MRVALNLAPARNYSITSFTILRLDQYINEKRVSRNYLLAQKEAAAHIFRLSEVFRSSRVAGEQGAYRDSGDATTASAPMFQR